MAIATQLCPIMNGSLNCTLCSTAKSTEILRVPVVCFCVL